MAFACLLALRLEMFWIWGEGMFGICSKCFCRSFGPFASYLDVDGEVDLWEKRLG